MSFNEKIKTLVLSKKSSGIRERIKKAMGQDFELSFISSFSDLEETIKQHKPKVFLHDWDVSLEEKNRREHYKIAQSTSSTYDGLVRIVIVENITPSLIAFSNEAFIEKVIDYNTAKLNLSMTVEMIVNSQENKMVYDIFKASKLTSGEYSQKEVDIMVESAFTNFPHDSNAKIEMANLNIRRDEIDEAYSLVKPIFDEDGTNLRAMNVLSRVLMKKNMWSEATALLNKADKLGPNNSQRLLLLGDACFGKGDLDKSLDYYGKAAEENPEMVNEAKKSMGKVKLTQGDIEGALDLLQNGVSEEEAAGVFNNAAVAAVKEKRYDDAIRLYENALRALKTDKLKHIVYFNLGLSHRRKGNTNKALENIRRALEFKPDYQKAINQLDQIEGSIPKVG